jgi:hypothetical protein
MSGETGFVVFWLTLAAAALSGDLIYRAVAKARKRR